MRSILSNAELRQTTVYTILFLFFFQLVADFVEAVYAFGLMGTGIPNEIASVLFFLSPLLLLIFGKPFASKGMVLLGELVLVSRVIEPLLDTRGKMLVSGLGVGSFLLFLPILLWKLGKTGRPQAAYPLGAGLALSLALSVLLRTWNSGSDLSTQGMFQIIGWGFAIIAGVVLPILFRNDEPTAEPSELVQTAGFGRLAGLCIGILSAFIMLYFTFTSPNVIARWTGSSYLAILVTLAIGMTLFGVGITTRLDQLIRLPRGWLIGWNVLFILALVFTILPHQLAFPADPGGYPLSVPPVKFPRLPIPLPDAVAQPDYPDGFYSLLPRAAGSPTPGALAGRWFFAGIRILLVHGAGACLHHRL